MIVQSFKFLYEYWVDGYFSAYISRNILHGGKYLVVEVFTIHWDDRRAFIELGQPPSEDLACLLGGYELEAALKDDTLFI